MRLNSINFKFLFFKVNSFFLLLKIGWFNKSLKLKSFNYVGFAIDGVDTELIWNVEGCYKIEIKGLRSFPGNISGLRFPFSKELQKTEVIFHGLNNKKITKKVEISCLEVDLTNKFFSDLNKTENVSMKPIFRSLSLNYKKQPSFAYKRSMSMNYEKPISLNYNQPISFNYQKPILSSFNISLNKKEYRNIYNDIKKKGAIKTRK